MKVKTRFKSATIENRKARHEYFTERTIECGIELKGNEVKSIRDGKASIQDAWVDIQGSQLLIKQMHITSWETANKFDVDAKREIRLLAHKQEILKMSREVQREGYTLIPLKIYFNNRGKCKLLLGVCKGKKLYDKRQSDKNRTLEREMQRYK